MRLSLARFCSHTSIEAMLVWPLTSCLWLIYSLSVGYTPGQWCSEWFLWTIKLNGGGELRWGGVEYKRVGYMECEVHVQCEKIQSELSVIYWSHNTIAIVLLAIFMGTNLCETGQNLGFRNFCSFNFRGQWIWDLEVIANTAAKSWANVWNFYWGDTEWIKCTLCKLVVP